jgi:hypothetical protein
VVAPLNAKRKQWMAMFAVAGICIAILAHTIKIEIFDKEIVAIKWGPDKFL